MGRAASNLEIADVSYGFEIFKTEQELDMFLSKWFGVFGRDDDADLLVESADASRDGTAKPLAATESELLDDGSLTATSIESRHEDGSFPFPHRLRQHHSSEKSSLRPSWWRRFFL